MFMENHSLSIKYILFHKISWSVFCFSVIYCKEYCKPEYFCLDISDSIFCTLILCEIVHLGF